MEICANKNCICQAIVWESVLGGLSFPNPVFFEIAYFDGNLREVATVKFKCQAIDDIVCCWWMVGLKHGNVDD